MSDVASSLLVAALAWVTFVLLIDDYRRRRNKAMLGWFFPVVLFGINYIWLAIKYNSGALLSDIDPLRQASRFGVVLVLLQIILQILLNRVVKR